MCSALQGPWVLLKLARRNTTVNSRQVWGNPSAEMCMHLARFPQVSLHVPSSGQRMLQGHGILTSNL